MRTHRPGRWKLGVGSGLLAALAASSVLAQPATADVTAKARVDRTAVWVADRVTYIVDLTCRRGADVLLDDLARDKLKLDGLDVVSTDSERHEEADGTTHYEFRYVLATYRVDQPTLTVSGFPVRYYIKRAGQRVEDTAPAGTLQVPGASLAFRSLLPDGQASYDVRDARGAAPRPLAFRILEPVGIGLIVLSIAPVLLLGIGAAREARLRRQGVRHRSRRQVRQEIRAALAEVRDAPVEGTDARREAFARLDALVRRHLVDTSGVPAASLTPAEVNGALQARPSRGPADTVTAILTTCEVARYAPPAQLPSADAWRDTLAQAEQLIG